MATQGEWATSERALPFTHVNQANLGFASQSSAKHRIASRTEERATSARALPFKHVNKEEAMGDIDMLLEHAKNDYEHAVIQHGEHSEEARDARASIMACIELKRRRGKAHPLVMYRMYRCEKCGHQRMSQTNHTGSTYSVGHYATCAKCPPWAKYPEFGGGTVWAYVCEIEPQPYHSSGQLLERIERLESWGYDMTNAWDTLAKMCM